MTNILESTRQVSNPLPYVSANSVYMRGNTTVFNSIGWSDGKIDDAQYDKILAITVKPELSEIERDFAHGHTYSLEQWLEDTDD